MLQIIFFGTFFIGGLIVAGLVLSRLRQGHDRLVSLGSVSAHWLLSHRQENR